MLSALLALSATLRLVLCDCSTSPVLALPVTDVLLSNDQTFRGVPLTVGTPPQNISFLPEAWFNDTWIYNDTSTFCDWNTPTGCLTVRGGYYNTSSTSAKPADNVTAAGGDPSDTERALGLHIWYNAWVNDDLNLGNVTLPGYPIAMPGFEIFGSDDTQAQVGLGQNSTLLATLKSAEHIVSKSFSWWFGWAGAIPSTQMDGQLVFGGYDAAKVSGTNYTKPLATPSYTCPSGMSIILSDLVLNFPNGTDASIIGTTAITACIAPDYPNVLTMPSDPYYSNFEAASQTTNIGRGGGNGIDYGGVLYWPSEVYQGDLTIEIDDSISVRIPNELLVTPPANVIGDGSTQYNQSVREVLLDPTTGYIEEDPALLGRHFFQSAYLAVDYDSGSFTLWQANATTNTDLVAFGACDDSHDNSSNDTKPSSTSQHFSSPTTSSSSATNAKQDSVKHLSAGAIAGVAVGSALGAAVIIAVLWACCIRRRKGRHGLLKQDPSLTFAPKDGEDPHDGDERYTQGTQTRLHEAMSSEVQEMGAEQKPMELSNGRKSRHWNAELPAHGSPAELG